MVDKNKAMFDYFQTCEYVLDLFFNFSQSNNNDVQFNPIASDEFITEFIDGSGIKHYDFTLSVFKPISTEANSTENIDIQADVENIQQWIRDNEKNSVYPDFGGNCQIISIENLVNSPTISGTDEIGTKYLIQCRVEYLQESEE